MIFAMGNFTRAIRFAGLIAFLALFSLDCQAAKVERSWICKEEKLGTIDLKENPVEDEVKLLQELQKMGLLDIFALIAEDNELDQNAIWLSATLPPPYEPVDLSGVRTTRAPKFHYAESVELGRGDSAPQLEPRSYQQHAQFMSATANSRLIAGKKKNDISALPGVQEVVTTLMNPDSWDAETLMSKGELQGVVLDVYSMFREKRGESRDTSRLKELISARIAQEYPGIGWYRKKLSESMNLWALLDLKFESGVETVIAPVIPIMLLSDNSGVVSTARITESDDESQLWYYSLERDERGSPISTRLLIGREFEGHVSYDIFLLCSQQGVTAGGSK